MRTRTMHNEWIRLISATSLLGLAAIAPTEGWVTGLSKQEIGKGVQLKIEGTGLSKPREIRVLGGAGYIVEFDAQLQGGPKKLTVDSGGVSTARAGWYHSKPPVVRVLVRLNPNEKPILAACADGYTVSVLTAATAVRRVLAGDWSPGFETPARVFGAAFVLEVGGAALEDPARERGEVAA